MDMRKLCGLAVLTILGGCGLFGGPTYTLYRSSAMSDGRVTFATFNARQSGDFNRENCEMTAGLLNANLHRVNPTSPVRFWCQA